MERNVLNKSFQGAHKSNRKYNFFFSFLPDRCGACAHIHTLHTSIYTVAAEGGSPGVGHQR